MVNPAPVPRLSDKLLLDRQFNALTGFSPLSWQSRLFSEYFERSEVPAVVDIPTGLGKTAVMALWLIARARGAQLPRRLVYVVDRRAVVDQASEFAVSLRKSLESDDAADVREQLDLGGRPLPISTLRGQYADNREWLENPASPAIIVGTVDMIGSRLLFEGYGVSRKMRPYHAGLLGADTLLVLDEAHLVPPFEKLLETIERDVAQFAAPAEANRRLIPSFKLLSLSATGRERPGSVFRLEGSFDRPSGDRCDLDDPVVEQRLRAKKAVKFVNVESAKLEQSLAAEAWALATRNKAPIRCLVYCNQRDIAEATKTEIESLARGGKTRAKPAVEIDIELLVGARRVFEREQVSSRLKDLGFIGGTFAIPARPAFLIATSAGEVGVDLDADHMVGDLVAWERMVQRLGRVNRRGRGDASVVVVIEPEPKPDKSVTDALSKPEADRKDKDRKEIFAFEALVNQIRSVRRLFDEGLPRGENEAADASPGALRDLKVRAESSVALRHLLQLATTPAPFRPELTRALVDAWSMTSLEDHAGRPEVAPWLRGWVDEKPTTAVVWRTHLPVRVSRPRAIDREVEAFFEAAPTHTTELLETETYRVVQWLIERATKRLKQIGANKEAAKAPTDESEEPAESSGLYFANNPPPKASDTIAFVLSNSGTLRQTLSYTEIIDCETDKGKKRQLEAKLNSAILVVDAGFGGLSDGLLDSSIDELPRCADDDDDWIGAAGNSNDNPKNMSSSHSIVGFRIRCCRAGYQLESDRNWRERLRFDVERSDDGEKLRWIAVEKWRHDAATEEDRSAGNLQTLDEHQSWTEQKAIKLARSVGLEGKYVEMLASAARLHDEGKRAVRWQRAFNAPLGNVYAKTLGPLNLALLDEYRHEFGSLPHAEADERFRVLPPDMQDLLLHLIASHHGKARPVISTKSCDDAPPSILVVRAREVALRFARLQKRWGPWGLAWWEALLRSADQQASRDNDALDNTKNGRGV